MKVIAAYKTELAPESIESTRVWKGDDATYFIVVLKMEYYRQGPPVQPFDKIQYLTGATVRNDFVVREITADFRTQHITISSIDERAFDKLNRLAPEAKFVKPPRFSSQEEADAWLEQHG